MVHLTALRWTPEGGGGTLIFSYIRRLGPFFGVQNFKFQYFLGFSEKNDILWGMKILWIFFGGLSQKWTIFRGHFYAFLGFFLKVKVQNVGYFWGC